MKEHGCLKLDRLYLPHKSQEPMGSGVECYGLNMKCLFKVPVLTHFGPQLVAPFRKVATPLGGEASPEEVGSLGTSLEIV